MFEGSVLKVGYKQDAVLAYAFPELDREREYREMDSWLIANPHKRPKRHMARFVHNWLSKAARHRRAALSEASVGRAPASLSDEGRIRMLEALVAKRERQIAEGNTNPRIHEDLKMFRRNLSLLKTATGYGA